MSTILIIANWKSNKTFAEIEKWFKTFNKLDIHSLSLKNKKIIICPSFIHIPYVRELIDKYSLPIELCAQDISEFTQGAYTGEVNAKQLKEFVNYVLIGHSERRKYFAETDSILEKKVSLAILSEITPIFCVPSSKVSIPQQVEIIAYEPPNSIGNENPEKPEEVERVRNEISSKNNRKVLYGGSVTPKNAKDFMSLNLSGVLVGTCSLDPYEFFEIIKNA